MTEDTGNNFIDTSKPEEISAIPVIAPEESSVNATNERIPTIPQLLVALALLLCILSAPYLSPLITKVVQVTHFASSPPSQPTATPQAALVYKSTTFSDAEIQAESAYVWDVALQRALFSKNAHAQLPLASLTKLMTALVAAETNDPSALVAIGLPAIQQEGEDGFSEGEKWSTKNLLDFTLVTSSNDGAFALAGSAGAALLRQNKTPEESFVDAMNVKAEDLGLTQTYFTNPTGLDTSESQSGSYGSARDMAFLMEYIVQHAPELLEKTTQEIVHIPDAQGTLFTAKNTNEHIDTIDNPLGSKTGYTTLAGGNLVVAFNIGLNHPVIVSVMGSSREGRFSDVRTLIEHTKKLYTPEP